MKKNRFEKRIPITHTILSKIARIDQFKGLWHGSMKISPQILGRLKSRMIITSTGASTRIEGAKMSDDKIARFLRGLKAKRPQNRDEQEVAGYADLIGRVFDNFSTIQLTEGWILQMHSILLHFSNKDQTHKGKYKNCPNTVVMKNSKGKDIILFNPTPPHLVKIEMQTIIEWTNEQLKLNQIHPLLLIANFIFEFLAIHPFKDGNGRMSRALTNLLLLKTGYNYVPYVSLDEIIEQNRSDYYLALRATQKNHKKRHENITPWVDYLLDVLIKQSEQAKKLMEMDQPEKLLSKKQMEIYGLFKNNQELSIAEIHELLTNKTPLITIKKALKRLVDLKLLEKIGQARATRYRKI